MNKPLILVVEDDAPIRNLITTTLKTQDYKYIADILNRQCDRNDGNDQHNGKGDRVAALVCVQRQAGLCKTKIEKKHAGKRA